MVAQMNEAQMNVADKSFFSRSPLHRFSRLPYHRFSLSPRLPVSLSHVFVLLCLLLPSTPLYSLEIPLDFHGRGLIGKYLNSDTARYHIDASVGLYCTMLRVKDFSFFVYYRDDLEVARTGGGVVFDPRYAHYYLASGFDYFLPRVFLRLDYTHDCVHDIDYEVEGTPIFNRFRFQIASKDFHYSNYLASSQKFLWSWQFTYYAHWQYQGWDINAGADYNYDTAIELAFKIMKSTRFGSEVIPRFQVARGDTSFYHQDLVKLIAYYMNNHSRLGLELSYNILNNDPIKNPEHLWLLSIFAEF